jgi:nuclear transport factor 2 (NTF2) superfamily protein
LIDALPDELSRERVEIDRIKFAGRPPTSRSPWQQMVPATVAQIIKAENHFGWRPGRVTSTTGWGRACAWNDGASPVTHAFLAGKWQRELENRLVKELWAFDERRIAVRCQYEWHNDAGQWFRIYGWTPGVPTHAGIAGRRGSLRSPSLSQVRHRFARARPVRLAWEPQSISQRGAFDEVVGHTAITSNLRANGKIRPALHQELRHG